MKFNGEIPLKDVPVAIALIALLFFVSGLKDATMMSLIIAMMVFIKPYRSVSK